MKTKPRVLNKYRHVISKNAIWIMRGYKYGNPFIIGKHGDRNDVCNLYESYVKDRFSKKEIQKDLKGKDLVCCCKPLRCHGDYLLRIANEK
ncbi:MAG TPA: DUF4326 domain-containing protein [Candidatus Pacearchaeota archaeon]|nr:DUF4326 domain-containing protein [Candidatus Pacearchaeota archaeon]